MPVQKRPAKLSLLLYIFLFLRAAWLFSDACEVMPGERTFILHEIPAASKALPPLQGLIAPKVYSVTVSHHDMIDYYYKKYTSAEGLKWLSTVLERGRVYREHILKSLRNYDVPRELLFLPVVESSYYPQAVSRSGAVGLWQFMLNSIGPYDMAVNEWIDERRDFWKSTDASIQKLKYNYSRFGNWLLALAAYNCGVGRLEKIIKQTGIRDFWELADGGYLPEETRRYVPKFLAIASICEYPGRYGLPVSWDIPDSWDRIPIDRPIDIRLLSAKSGVPLNILTLGNSELKYFISPPDDPHYFLKVPSKYSDEVKGVLAKREISLMRFYLYKINAGDTLYALSLHYGVSVAMIEQYNSGLQPTRLQIGQNIVIPSLKKVKPYESKVKTGDGS